MAYWLLTWTTYGSWLPGDPRGSTIRVPDEAGRRTFRQISGRTRRAAALAASARGRLKSSPIWLNAAQAQRVLCVIRSQSTFRQWELFACAVMANHAHAVVGQRDGEDPSRALSTFKSYASRDLNRRDGRPLSGTWWTQSGSTRRLRSEPNVLAAVRYVQDQAFPLATWLHPNFRPPDAIGP